MGKGSRWDKRRRGKRMRRGCRKGCEEFERNCRQGQVGFVGAGREDVGEGHRLGSSVSRETSLSGETEAGRGHTPSWEIPGSHPVHILGVSGGV